LLSRLQNVNGQWLLWGVTFYLNNKWIYLKKQNQQKAMALGSGKPTRKGGTGGIGQVHVK
jgi:hypothetical protein